jgi:hypothetical protein
MQVAPYVMLHDPNNNEFEVKVEKKNKRVYFTDDLSMLNFFYQVLVVAWMTVIFANKNLKVKRDAHLM